MTRLGKAACPLVLNDQKMAVDDHELISGHPHDDQNLSYDDLNFLSQINNFSIFKRLLEILKITFVLRTTRWCMFLYLVVLRRLEY